MKGTDRVPRDGARRVDLRAVASTVDSIHRAGTDLSGAAHSGREVAGPRDG